MGSKFAPERNCLIVESEPPIRMQLEDTLRDAGINIFASAGSGDEALLLIDGHQPDFAIINPAERNAKLAQHLRRLDIPFIIFTAYSKIEMPPEFTGMPVVRKPFVPHELVTTATAALQRADFQ